MCCQKPFNISTSQPGFKVFERVKTLFNIWFDIPSFVKILLAFLINLWLSTPLLSLLSPICFPGRWVTISGTQCSKDLLAILPMGVV